MSDSRHCCSDKSDSELEEELSSPFKPVVPGAPGRVFGPPRTEALALPWASTPELEAQFESELDSELEERLRADRLRAGSAGGLRKWWQDRRLARG